MKKYAWLQKRLAKEGLMLAGIAIAALCLMEVASGIEGDAATSLRRVESTLRNTTSQLSAMRQQISKLDTAKQRYVDIRLLRDQEEYSPNNEMLRERLVMLKSKYRLDDSFSLKLSPESQAQGGVFSALNHDVFVRNNMLLSFGAISDLHAFSFLNEFQRSMPGIIRLTNVSLTRTSDINVTNLSSMARGFNPSLVQAEIEFVWVTLTNKEGEK
jgi:hypothetical protein